MNCFRVPGLSWLGPNIKSRRHAVGRPNQGVVGRKAGMTQQHYQKIEAGSDLMVSTLLRVLDTLDLEMVLVPRNDLPLVEKALLGKEMEATAADYDPTQGIWKSIFDEEDGGA